MIDKQIEDKKNIENNKSSSKIKKVLKIILIIIFIISIIVLYSRFIGTKGLVVKETKIVNENFIDNFYGLKIIHISDIHYGMTTGKEDLEKIVTKINLLKPDIVFFTGDLYSTDISDDDKKDMVDILKNIKANIKKYAVKGNHDDNIDDWDSIMKEISFIDLDNNIDLIYNTNQTSILIAGINTNEDISESGTKIAEALKPYEDNESKKENIIYKILILHEPDKIEELDYSKYDLILAGHSHNGQIRLPFIGALYTPVGSKKYYDEYYELDNTKLYVSSGIGTSIIKFRLFNHPSFNLYRLASK